MFASVVGTCNILVYVGEFFLNGRGPIILFPKIYIYTYK